MNLTEWLKIYGDICSDLGIVPQDDYESSVSLSVILGGDSSMSVLEKYYGGTYWVIGGGKNLSRSIDMVEGGRTIVADSALGTFIDNIGIPDIVVTDLDSEISRLVEASENGSLLVIHAHGDNRDLISRYSRNFYGKVIGTTQNMPLENVFNFFGFTDGDRSAYLAHHLKAESINLIGFDFENPAPKEGSDPDRKLVKLKWARKLLNNLAMERGKEFVDGDLIIL